jgi:hypothetical protein
MTGSHEAARYNLRALSRPISVVIGRMLKSDALTREKERMFKKWLLYSGICDNIVGETNVCLC